MGPGPGMGLLNADCEGRDGDSDSGGVSRWLLPAVLPAQALVAVIMTMGTFYNSFTPAQTQEAFKSSLTA